MGSGLLADKYEEVIPISNFFFYTNQSTGLDQDVKCEWIPNMFWRWTQQDWLLTDEGSEKREELGKETQSTLSKKLMWKQGRGKRD